MFIHLIFTNISQITRVCCEICVVCGEKYTNITKISGGVVVFFNTNTSGANFQEKMMNLSPTKSDIDRVFAYGSAVL